ncbi:hypothetical protein K470DRAFT_173946 [Piedraia hortae CBS 480.64]|uniref:Apoptosis-inducing TAF9-like domain 1 family protein n=1 Tax=Piedraia hortae CBS 480.64 TaxID=1314780 RepID=A0A6A7C4Z7_9PEZI|nr:hypothetical protein K470DRAFT_173946 [Piedraia hortae CBS 480.64]
MAEEDKTSQLKSALWFSIGQTVDAVGMTQDCNASPHFIGGLSELVWAQIENAACDLEAFARHAGRSTICDKDVILLARRNEGLERVLSTTADEVKKGKR